MYDTTVLRPFGARDSFAITQRDPRPEESGTKEPGTEAADHADDLLAAILTTNWTLATGRTLPAGVSPRSLSDIDTVPISVDPTVRPRARASSGWRKSLASRPR